MADITDLNRDDLPSTASLVKATFLALALALAIAILLTVVLPAEYGIDPTGIGQRLGLTVMSRPEANRVPQPEPAAALEPPVAVPVPMLSAVWKAPVAYRNDKLSITLAPNEGGEIKVLMKAGDRFFFSWEAEGSVVNFDMHGEDPEADSDEFTSYWKDRNQSAGHGAFEAPFDGTHGWFWRNRSDKPVTITVKTSGYYEKLYRP